jgi:hypothetical protein
MSACGRGFGVLLVCVVVVVSPKSIGHAEAAGLLFASSSLLLLWVLRFALFDLRFAYSLFCSLFGCAYRFLSGGGCGTSVFYRYLYKSD